jgi:hypothetical protein
MSACVPKLLLKARPTPVQLSDRLREPLPDGLELYLDLLDLRDQAAMDRAVAATEAATEAAGLSSQASLLIEGPVRSLDGEFFSLPRESEADREVIRRLALLAARLKAEAVNIHVIAPTEAPSELGEQARREQLARGLPLIELFVDAMLAGGVVPTVENMPPVLRMRQGGFFYSAIGMPAEDLTWLCDQAPGLRTTLDLSHAGLYVNCQRFAEAGDVQVEGACEPLFRFVRGLPRLESVADYASSLGETLLTCHVSNAVGLLGEGEAYYDGDLDLDVLIPRLAGRVRYFVTETLEENPARATAMREALAAMRGLSLRHV